MAFTKGITGRGVMIMIIASLGGLLFGLDNGWWGTVLGERAFLAYYGSCATVDGVETCNLSAPQQSAGSGVQSAGIMIGCGIAMYLNDLIGRRRSFIVMGLVATVGIVIEMTSATGDHARYGQFLAGKVINSVAMGLGCNIVPVYLSETSIASARALTINMYQNVQIIGLLIAVGVVYGVSEWDSKGAYLLPMGLQWIAPGAILLTSPWIPESPRWLVWKGRKEEAIASASSLFNTDKNDFDAVEFVNKLEVAFEYEKAEAQVSGWADLFRQPELRRMLIAIGIQSLQQAQGSSYMNSYIVPFLEGLGITNYFPIILGVDFTYYAGILTGHFLPDMFGRRVILISSSAFCAVTLIIIAIITTAIPEMGLTAQKACIALIFLWNLSFGVNSPLVWITTAEVAPTRNREKVLGMATFWGFGVSLLISFVSPYIQNAEYGGIGSKIGFIWGCFSIANIAFVFWFVPEMKGLSLEQLDFLFNERVNTRKFAGYHFSDDVLGDLARTDGNVEELPAGEYREKDEEK